MISIYNVYHVMKDFHAGNWSPSDDVLNFWVILAIYLKHNTYYVS